MQQFRKFGTGRHWTAVFDLSNALGQARAAVATYFRGVNFAVSRRPCDLPDPARKNSRLQW